VAVFELTGGSGASPVEIVPNSVAAFDLGSGRAVGDVTVGTRPEAVAFGAGAVWVANGGDRTVSRIDPRTMKTVSTIGIGADVSDLAVGFGSVWVANGNAGTLTRVDPATNAVQATLRLGGSSPLSTQPVFSVATGEGSVWVTRGDSVLRIDPKTNEVIGRIRAEPLTGIAVGNGSVWVTTTIDHVLRIDARSGTFTGSASLPDQGIRPVLAGNSLWMIVGSPGKLWRLDAGTLSPSGTAPGGAFAVDLASDGRTLWLAKTDGGLLRVDPSAGEVTERTMLGPSASGVAVGGGKAWVTVDAAS
jgi:streptogramin lyase